MKDNATPLVRQQGYAIYSVADLMGHGRKGRGRVRANPLEYDWNFIDPQTAVEITRHNPYIGGIIYNRANEISGLKWRITATREIEDEIFEILSFCKHLYDESLGVEFDFAHQPQFVADSLRRRVASYIVIWQRLSPFGLKPDLSNYQKCLIYWRKALARRLRYSTDQIGDWLERPGDTRNMSDWLKQYALDMPIQGRVAIRQPTEYYDGISIMPGGSVYPVKGKYIGEPEAYVQLMTGMRRHSFAHEPIVFQPNEVSMAYYMPNSALAFGMKPIDALVNIAMETSNFSALMRDNANGEMLPNKLVMVLQGDPNANTDLARVATGAAGVKAVDEKEIKRLNELANQKAKDQAIRFLKSMGGGHAEIDMTKSETFAAHLQREDMNRRTIAIALSATDNEINNNDSGGGLSKAGAEANAAVYNRRGIKPICMSIEDQLTRDIFPRRFGAMRVGHGTPPIYNEFQFAASKTQAEMVEDALKAAQVPALSMNNILTMFLDMDPVPDPAYDEPLGKKSEGEQIAGAIGGISLSAGPS